MATLGIDTIFELYTKYGRADYIGESVSQLEHMIQAAMLAEADDQPPSMVLAALFHDIGHLVAMATNGAKDALGATDHEVVAHDYLVACHIPAPIPELVRGHVVAKRYLITKDPAYYDSLSPASRQTFVQQGGKLSVRECAAFEANPLAAQMLALRGYDDQAKVKDLPINDISYYKEMLVTFCAALK